MIKVAKACLGAEENAAVQQALAGGWLGMGNFTLDFEQRLAAWIGAPQLIAVNTGTSALHLCLHALGIGPGDEVLVPSLTYVASFQAISATGATPVACESHPETLLLDLDDAERRITPRTKAVMPVHYCGQPCDMDRLLSWRTRYGLRIVEDAAHALGSTYGGRKIGSFGDLTCFSFDAIKLITTGDGGAICTGDAALAARLRDLRLLGVDRESDYRYQNKRKWFYDVPQQGFRYHLNNLAASLGLAQLAKIDGFAARRQAICRRYDAALAGHPVVRTLQVDYAVTVPFMYVVRIVPAEQREGFMKFLAARDIETGVHYLPNHWHSYYQPPAPLPVADQLGREIVTLPLHAGLSDEEVAQVITAITLFAEQR